MYYAGGKPIPPGNTLACTQLEEEIHTCTYPCVMGLGTDGYGIYKDTLKFT
jgi:hypothetical protein